MPRAAPASLPRPPSILPPRRALADPLDFTFVCPTEITAFSDRAAEFAALKCKLAAVSIDSKFSHLAWLKTPRSKGGLGRLAIPVVSDLSRDMSRDFGVLIDDPADGDCGVAFRGTFVIDPAGIVRSVAINDLPVGRSVDEVLRIVAAFQHHAEHGDVCPAGWVKGKPTMVADPEKSAAYFKTLTDLK